MGLVCFSVAARAAGDRLTRWVHLPGGRADVRDRSTTVALHLVRRLLLGEGGDLRRTEVRRRGRARAGRRAGRGRRPPAA